MPTNFRKIQPILKNIVTAHATNDFKKITTKLIQLIAPSSFAPHFQCIHWFDNYGKTQEDRLRVWRQYDLHCIKYAKKYALEKKVDIKLCPIELIAVILILQWIV